MVVTVTHITARALLAGLDLPAVIREQTRTLVQAIEESFAPFLVNQAHAVAGGMVLGLQLAQALPVAQLAGLREVFKAAQRARLDQLAASAATSSHEPVLMDERAAFSAFHVRCTKKEVEQQPKNGGYNDGWTSGAHEAWFARADLARAAARAVGGACGACGHAVELPAAVGEVQA